MDSRLFSNLERVVAHTEDVEAGVGDATFLVTQIARERLSRHRHLGEHKITQTKGKVDHYVNLVGPAAVSVELGHHNHWDGSWVEGLHILDDAIHLHVR
jgi:hypothetical protein